MDTEVVSLYGPNVQSADNLFVNLEASRSDRYVNVGIKDKSILSKPSSKKRKNPRKSVAQLVYGEENLEANLSDVSLSDDDIEHRNSVILKEVVASWEVSQALGISFDCDKEQLIEVFMELEQEEMRGKSPCN